MIKNYYNLDNLVNIQVIPQQISSFYKYVETRIFGFFGSKIAYIKVGYASGYIPVEIGKNKEGKDWKLVNGKVYDKAELKLRFTDGSVFRKTYESDEEAEQSAIQLMEIKTDTARRWINEIMKEELNGRNDS